MFVDNIWRKIKGHSQYYHEEVQDWISYLEHFALVLIGVDTKCVPSEDLYVQYFHEGFRLLIKL